MHRHLHHVQRLWNFVAKAPGRGLVHPPAGDICRSCISLLRQGHRTLVFSQSRVMLDILQAAIKEAGWRFLRLDGSVTSAAERAVRC